MQQPTILQFPRLLFLTVFMVACLAGPVSGQTAAVIESEPSFDLVITGGHVFDNEAGKFKPNRGIGIRKGRFVSLDASSGQSSARESYNLDDENYILPGLVDCHAHYNVRLIRRRREEFTVTPVVYLANGVTVTFSCGEFDPEAMLDLRKRIESGEQIGPRLLNSGPYFGRARPGWRGEKPAEEIQAEVDLWANRGVGGFKAKQIGPNELKVLIAQAHKHGLTVTGHLDSGFRGSVNPRDAIEMGIDRIEHFLGGDSMPDSRAAYDSLPDLMPDMPEYKKIVQQFVDRGVWFDATISAYGYFGQRGEEFDQWIDERQFFTSYIQELVKTREPSKPNEQFEKIYQAKLRTTKAYFDAGGLMSLGTDHFSDGNFLAGFGAHRELDAFVRCGISPADAIRIGTINGARALGLEADHGSISLGKVADLFVIKGDPLDDIRRTRNVELVLRYGVAYRAKELLDGVVGKLGPADESEAANW